MIGFEAFQVMAWLDNGLIKHDVPKPSTHKKAATSPKRLKSLTALVLVTVATSVGASVTLEAGVSQAINSPTINAAPVSHAEADVPAGYWSKLMTELKNRPTLGEMPQDLDLPDPII